MAQVPREISQLNKALGWTDGHAPQAILMLHLIKNGETSSIPMYKYWWQQDQIIVPIQITDIRTLWSVSYNLKTTMKCFHSKGGEKLHIVKFGMFPLECVCKRSKLQTRSKTKHPLPKLQNWLHLLLNIFSGPNIMSSFGLDSNICYRKVKQQCPAFPFFDLGSLDHEANAHADKKAPLPLLCQTVRTPLLSWIRPFSFLIKGSFYPPSSILPSQAA